MRTENPAGLFFDKHFEPVDGLCNAARGVPVRALLVLRPKLEPLLARLLLTQSHGGNGREREGDARYAAVVWLLLVAVQHVGGNDLRVVARNGGERRAFRSRIACGIDGGVRYTL